MTLIENHINTLLPLLVISAISRVIPGIEFLHYLTPILLILFIISGYDQILKNKQLRILTILLGSFGLWAGLTSFWSDFPLVSLSRAAYFLLVAFGAAFGVVLWLKERTLDKNVFGFLLPANILVVVSSLVSLIIGFPENSWTGGNGMGFMGFAAHQNTFAMILLFTFPALLYPILKEIHNFRIVSFLIYILLIASSIWFLVLSHSRASLLALTVGIFLAFIFYTNLKQRLLLIGGLLFVAILVFTIPSLKSKAEQYALKGTSHITANREILWGPSYKAAKIGGLFGIGYGTSLQEMETPFQQIDEGGRLRREKGNSILALIEEVGLVGLVIFLLPIISAFLSLSNQNKISLKKPLPLFVVISFSFLIAFILHSQFEAWWVGTGSFSLMIFLLIITLSVIGKEI